MLHFGDHRLATSGHYNHVCIRSSKRSMRLACAHALLPALTGTSGSDYLGQRIITSPALADEIMPIRLKCSGVGSCLRHWSIFDIANTALDMAVAAPASVSLARREGFPFSRAKSRTPRARARGLRGGSEQIFNLYHAYTVTWPCSHFCPW